MKIERIRSFLVDRCLLVRVYTDQGIVGTGEAGLWAHHKLVHEAIEQLAEYYVSKDPGTIEHHFQTISRTTHFQGAVLSAALSAIDVALWDIKGKALGKPVYDLLGGKVRDKVKGFANVVGPTLEDRITSAARNVEQGYTSLRTIPMFPGFEQKSASRVVTEAISIVKAIRETVGYDIDLGVEIHRNMTKPDVVVFANAVAEYRLLYLEDPLQPQSTDALRYVADHIDIPLAAGERSYNLFQFKEIVDIGAVALVRPDLSLAGGFTQVKKIAALAESAFIGVFPHLMGSPVNQAAYIQLDAAIPNYFLQESHTVGDALNEILEEPLVREGGYVLVPDRPGIGVEIREEKLAQFPYRGHKIVGNFHADGSVAH